MGRGLDMEEGPLMRCVRTWDSSLSLPTPPHPLPRFLCKLPDLFSALPNSMSLCLSFPVADLFSTLPLPPGTGFAFPFPLFQVGPTFLTIPSMIPLSLTASPARSPHFLRPTPFLPHCPALHSLHHPGLQRVLW